VRGVLHSPGQAEGSPVLLRSRHEHVSRAHERPVKRGLRARRQSGSRRQSRTRLRAVLAARCPGPRRPAARDPRCGESGNSSSGRRPSVCAVGKSCERSRASAPRGWRPYRSGREDRRLVITDDRERRLLRHLFSSGGGIPLEHCAVIDDACACALEYNVGALEQHGAAAAGRARHLLAG
jgi:hypothetical protein